MDDDFYIENGLYVFTEKYLLKRGYCCHHQCRHCPYEKNNKNYGENSLPDTEIRTDTNSGSN